MSDAARPRATGALHVCSWCHSDMVYPLDWCDLGFHRWRVLLRCPECEGRREGVFDRRAVERMDDELDRSTKVLLESSRRLTHANMSEEVDWFVRAVEAGLIVPDDF